MPKFTIVVGCQSNVGWLCADIALELAIPVSGTYPKSKAKLPKGIEDKATLTPNDTSSFGKTNLINIKEAQSLLIITDQKDLDKEHKALIKFAESERIPTLSIDINDHLAAIASRFDWWVGEYKIDKLFVKSAFNFEKQDRIEKVFRKLLGKKG